MAEKTYRSRRTVRARVLENDETVVTHRGPVTAKRGHVVLSHDSGDVHVIEPEDFDSAWEEVPEDFKDATPTEE